MNKERKEAKSCCRIADAEDPRCTEKLSKLIDVMIANAAGAGKKF